MKYLGIDYGTKKVGLALSDDSGTFAFPYGVVLENDALQKIKALLVEHEITSVIIGKSIALDGSDNAVMEHITHFAKQIESETNTHVLFQDERFSSRLADTHPTRKKKKPQTRTRVEKKETGKTEDAEAAAVILQSYLDSLSN